MVTNSVPKGTEWIASLMLVLQGLAATTWVVINYGWRRGLLAASLILGLAFLVETVGVLTSFPFGRYYYTDVLTPKLFIVPVGIMFAWLMLTLSSFFMTRFLVGSLFPRWQNSNLIVVWSAILAVISDTQMEPVAYHVKDYWRWETNGVYYGVPLSNFIAWLIISLLLLTVLRKITGDYKLTSATPETPQSKPRFGFVPIALYILNLILFGAVNLSHGFYGAGLLGLTVTLICLYLTIGQPLYRSFNLLRPHN
jgi:putative membrane protein